MPGPVRTDRRRSPPQPEWAASPDLHAPLYSIVQINTPEEKPDNSAARSAVGVACALTRAGRSAATFAELERFLVDEYHKEPHTTTGFKPHEQ